MLALKRFNINKNMGLMSCWRIAQITLVLVWLSILSQNSTNFTFFQFFSKCSSVKTHRFRLLPFISVFSNFSYLVNCEKFWSRFESKFCLCPVRRDHIESIILLGSWEVGSISSQSFLQNVLLLLFYGRYKVNVWFLVLYWLMELFIIKSCFSCYVFHYIHLQKNS